MAIAHKDDNHHADASAFYKTFLLRKGVPVTTDYVLAETITLLRAKIDAKSAAFLLIH